MPNYTCRICGKETYSAASLEHLFPRLQTCCGVRLEEKKKRPACVNWLRQRVLRAYKNTIGG